MANSLRATVEQAIESGTFRRILMSRVAQFGRRKRMYLGARFLPERLLPNNKGTETDIKYRTVVANDGSRYSPAQKKGNDIVGSMEYSLGEQDIASEFTSEDYDTYIEIERLNSAAENAGNPGMTQMISLANWFDQRINLGLIEKIEKMRWEAIVDASVPLRGDNGYAVDVTLSNPAGHRFASTIDWGSAANNPLDDFYAAAAVLEDKGYEVGAWVAGKPVVSRVLRHPKVVTAVSGFVSVDGGGALVGNTRRVTLGALNAFLAEDGLPPLMQYDLRYRDQTTHTHFLKRDVLVGIALTGRVAEIDQGDDEPLTLEDTVGYVGVGRAAGQAAPGRAASVEIFDNKPPRAEFEGWQTSFPILQDPESVVVVTGIDTSAD